MLYAEYSPKNRQKSRKILSESPSEFAIFMQTKLSHSISISNAIKDGAPYWHSIVKTVVKDVVCLPNISVCRSRIELHSTPRTGNR